MTAPLETFIVIAGVSLGIFATIGILITARELQRLQVRCRSLEEDLSAMRREVDLVASIGTSSGRRMQSLEHEHSQVAARIERMELREPAPSFDQAIDSARRGTDPARLTEQFGLSQGEADLVSRLHGRQKRA